MTGLTKGGGSLSSLGTACGSSPWPAVEGVCLRVVTSASGRMKDATPANSVLNPYKSNTPSDVVATSATAQRQRAVILHAATSYVTHGHARGVAGALFTINNWRALMIG